MIFYLRFVIFSIMILIGFVLAVGSVRMWRTVSVVYVVTLLWYTLLCRLPSLILTIHAEDVSQPVTGSGGNNNVFMILKLIFGFQPDGNLEDNYIHAFVLNVMLFVPLGYLILLWLIRYHENHMHTGKKVILTLLSVCITSFCIECLQEITSLGMFDRMDLLANTTGGVIGICMVLLYAFIHD